MSDRFLPFALPSIGEEEINEVVDSLRSGWVTTGPKTARFEKQFAEYVGSRHALAINSATAGLHLSLEALGIAPGDLVVTTPYTFTATAEVIRYLGADPLFVDIDPATFNLDIDKLAEVLADSRFAGKIKAILPVHFAGLACDMVRIGELAGQYGLPVVEDAAHALPASCDGKLIGGFSQATVFSFYATKTITTGEGGMVTTDDDALANRIRTMRLHGINRDVWDRYTSSKPSWYYEVVAPGFKYNMTDIAAALGIHQLASAESFRARRAEIASVYDAAFAGQPLTLPGHAPAGELHAWHLYVVRLQAERLNIGRDRFIELMAEAGIGTSVHFIPLHLHPYWRERYGFADGSFPLATEAYRQAVSLPIYPGMSGQDVERVIEAVTSILEAHAR